MLRKRGQTSTTPCNIQNVEAWPKARNISAQHLTTLLHDVATCVLNGVAKRTQHFHHVNVHGPQAPGAQEVDLARMP